MSEPDRIPVGLDELLAYRHKQAMRDSERRVQALRAAKASLDAQMELTNRFPVLTSQDIVRHMAVLVSAELGKRADQRRC